MRAAVLHEIGATPQFVDFADPVAGDGNVVVEVSAAGVNHVELLKASGKFYTGPPVIPSVPGSDGVGRLPDGRRVFFDTMVAPHGSWAERAVVPQAALLDVAEGVDDAVAAALGNTGLAAWLALEWRAGLQPGETVLVLGAAGALGRVAIQVARILGAGTVVAADRSADRVDELTALGCDAVVVLPGNGSDTDLAAQLKDATGGGADVVVDPLWGAPALAAMQAAAPGCRHVQLGQLAGVDLALPAPVVRSAALNLLGMAVFQASLETRRDAYLRLTGHAAAGEVSVDLERIALEDVAEAWRRQKAGPQTKLVFVP
jgi:NADPH:quinone reductase-like Zn-dependent oxidoreductase